MGLAWGGERVAPASLFPGAWAMAKPDVNARSAAVAIEMLRVRIISSKLADGRYRLERNLQLGIAFRRREDASFGSPGRPATS